MPHPNNAIDRRHSARARKLCEQFYRHYRNQRSLLYPDTMPNACRAPSTSCDAREMQALPLNFPRLLDDCLLCPDGLAKRHGGRWLAALLKDHAPGCTMAPREPRSEWIWLERTFSEARRFLGSRKRGSPTNAIRRTADDWAHHVAFHSPPVGHHTALGNSILHSCRCFGFLQPVSRHR
jgi:hypothetical protein